MQGTLGDMMFQYVLARSIAEDHGLALECLRVPARWNDWFPGAPTRLDGRCLPHPPLRVGTGTDCHRLNIDEILAHGRAIHLDGYFQRLEYYAGRLADAARWFATSDDGRPAVGQDDVVVHVKASVPLATRGWILPASYYRTAVESMPRGARILVCGDHASVDLAIPNRDVRVLDGGVRRQFSLLRRARYAVLSNDTTAWWAGALSNAVDMAAPETSTGAGFAFAGFEDVDLRLPTPPYRGIDVPRFADATILIASKVFGALAFSRGEGQAVVLPTGAIMHCPSGSLPAELLTALVSHRTLTSSTVPGGVRSTGLKWAVTHGLAEASLAPVH